MRVAVLGGGRSSEHDVSVASAEAVREGLAAAGHDPVRVDLARDGGWSCDGRPVPVEPGGGLLGADVVFPVLHGPFGEDGTVQGLLEIVDVPYVGAGPLASALCMHKLVFKRLMSQAGVPQVDFRGAAAHEGTSVAAARAGELGLPVFVKPARLGSSVGISKVEATEDLPRALEAAFAHDEDVIVEAMAEAREVECSVIGNRGPVASEPGEIILSGGWYDYEAKYEPGGMELVVPAPLDAATRDRVRELALAVFGLTGCAGMARVDFFLESSGRVLVNELNTIPGFTRTSVFARLFEASGVPYPELLDRLLSYAVERHRESRGYRL